MSETIFEYCSAHGEAGEPTDRHTLSDCGCAFRRTATRADLLDAVYATCPSLSRNEAREIFEMALEEVTGALVLGESVKLRGFGFFHVREKRARVGRNPRTGIEATITPRRVLTFKASPVLQDRVQANGSANGTANGNALGHDEKVK